MPLFGTEAERPISPSFVGDIGPMQPGFRFEGGVFNIDSAADRLELSPDDAVRILNKLAEARNAAEAADILDTEYYKGPTSPDPEHFHDDYQAA